jgi:hypothetical protein
MYILMLIMVLILRIASLILVFLFFFGDSIIFWKRKKQSIVSQFSTKTKNIVLWHLLSKRFFDYFGYLQIWDFLFLISLLCIMTIKFLFRLLTTWFFMNGLSTLRLIIILLVIISSMTPLLYPLFLLLYRLHLFTKLYFIFRFFFLVGKLLIFIAVAMWVWGEMLRIIGLFCFIVY